jgi:hypothetical protein
MPRPKQQHYVTRAYLEGFLSPSEQHLVCYGRGKGPFRKSPLDAASRRNYYAVRKQDGSWDDSLETLIGKTVEDPGLPVLQKLASGRTRLNWDERDRITLLLALQEMRTPAARERARTSSIMLNDRVIQEIKAADPDQDSVAIMLGSERKTVSLDEMVKAHDSLCDDHAKEIHRILVGAAFRLRDVYRQMKFTVYYATGQQDFITTDVPVVRVFHSSAPLGTGIDRRDIEIRFPLSRTALLTLTHDLHLVEALMRASSSKRSRLLGRLPEVRVQHVSDAEVTAFNKGNARHAHRWMFAPGEINWAPVILSGASAAPTIVDLSSGDLLHFQSSVNYDPKLDSP